jgi:quinol monooxygenase YgiN
MNKLQMAQQQLANLKKNETDIRQNSIILTSLWNDVQSLKKEMYDAKRKAAEEAEKPYLEAIENIETKYALLIKLQG